MTSRDGIKLTKELLYSHIDEVIYEDREIAGHRVITCHLKMDNGFVVYGKNSSTSIDPANFDEALGKQIAYEKTFSQLWELEAYRALIEQKHIEDVTSKFEVNIEDYEVRHRRGLTSYLNGPEFLTGHAQSAVYKHPMDDGEGVVACFFSTSNPSYDERQNGKAVESVKAYLSQFMTAKDIHHELVLKIARQGHEVVRAYNQFHQLGDGIREEDLSWKDTSEEHKQHLCEAVCEILLGRNSKPTKITEALFQSVVNSYK